jgi:hypothetical protein
MEKKIKKTILIIALIISALILFIIVMTTIIRVLGTYSTNKVCYKQSDCEGIRQAFCYFDKNVSGNLSGKCGLHLGCKEVLDEEGNLSGICVD